MKWFKFYGQDFITDPKMGALSTPQRLIWIYLLSMASQSEKKDGVLKFVTLNHLRLLAGITTDDENWKLSEKTLEVFEEMKLITWVDENTLKITNYEKYQEKDLTDAERAKRYRENKKNEAKKEDRHGIVTQLLQNRHTRIDKNREDIYINNGNPSPVVKTFQEAKNAIAQKLSFPKSGISTQWQEKAFRYADNLKIELNDELKARWLKIFKDATNQTEKAKKLEQAYSYLIDYFPFKSLGSKEKVLYFFKLYNDGVQKNAFQNGLTSLFVIVFAALVIPSFTFAKTVKVTYRVSSPYITKTSSSHKLQAMNVDKPSPTPPQTNTPVTAAGVQPVKKFLTDKGAKTREIVLAHLSKYYSGDDLVAADNILKKEAGYRYDAVNEQGCGGFPQACPASKMGCPLTEDGIICQADFFVGYLNRRYGGSPITAWEFWQARVPINGEDVGNWY